VIRLVGGHTYTLIPDLTRVKAWVYIICRQRVAPCLRS